MSEYASSTSIRNVLTNETLSHEEKLNNIKNVVPQNTYDYIKATPYHTNSDLWQNLKYEILKLGINGLKNIHGINEGLENRIYKKALVCNSYEQFIFNIKSKRYTLSKVKRICIYILLGITKEKYNSLKDVNYSRILKVKETSKKLLAIISKNATNLVLTKITDKILNNIDSKIRDSILLDILAHNLLTSDNTDYTNKITHP
jgi:predicted nucleotidyltransferase